MKKKEIEFHKKVKFSKEQRECVDEMFEELQTRMGEEHIKLVMKYKEEWRDGINSKVDVLNEMGIELIPIQSIYNILNEDEEDVEEKKFGF